jgi:AraC-like DNA-binding protein
MDIIYLLGTSQAFFLAILAFFKRNKSTGDYILASWLVFMGLHLLYYYLRTTGIIFQYPHLLGIGFCFPMLQGPFMFVYVLVMINKSGRFKPEYWLHGIPFIIFSLYFISDFYFLSADEKIAYYEMQSSNPTTVAKLTELLNVFLGPAYVIWSLFKLRKHKKNIEDNFSYTEQLNLNWLKYVLGGLGLVWLKVVFVSVLGGFPVFSEGLGGHIIYISVTIAVFFLGFFGIRQQAIYRHVQGIKEKKKVKKTRNPINNDAIYKHSGLKKADSELYLKELLNYMENEKPYLNNRLGLKDVAEYLNISVHHLSQVINEQLGKNFFDFVNDYRVKEVKSLLRNPKYKQFTLLAIAYDSGFNSKSSFNSVFKKITGLTPSNYIKLKVP